MTGEEVQANLNTRDLEWLESRWSVLNEAIKKIKPHLAEVEAAFDFDYTTEEPGDILEKSVCDQVIELCNVITTHDTENTMSWSDLLELIDLEIERRERLAAARKLKR